MIDLFQERSTNEVYAFFWSLSCLQGAYGNERCLAVDSHGQARGTKTYTRCANYKRIHPRLKAWSSVGLAFSGTREY